MSLSQNKDKNGKLNIPASDGHVKNSGNDRIFDDRDGVAVEKAHFYRADGKTPALSVNVNIAEKAETKAETAETKEEKKEKTPEKEFRMPEVKPSEKNKLLLQTLASDDIKSAVQEEKKRSGADIFRRVLMGFLVVVMLVSAANIVYETVSKHIANDYYSEIRDSFYSEDITLDSVSYLSRDISSSPEERLYSDEGDIYEAPDLNELDMHEKYERMLPNLQSLKKINSNVFAWIKVEGTRVDYPVVRSPQGNNDYYLSHALDRTYSVSGAVFTDYNNSTKLSNNRNTCVYGHNMNDGTMFQTIMNFKTRNQFLGGRIEMYTADGIYLYTPFSVYDAVPTERFFHTQFADDADYQSFLDDIISKSIFKGAVNPTVNDKVITLITCTNTVTDKRFVVHGVLTEVVR